MPLHTSLWFSKFQLNNVICQDRTPQQTLKLQTRFSNYILFDFPSQLDFL